MYVFSFYYIRNQICEADFDPLEERTWYKEGLSNRRAFIIVRLGNGHIFWVNFWYSVYLRISFTNRVSGSWYIIRWEHCLREIYGINLLIINRHAAISSLLISGHFSFRSSEETELPESAKSKPLMTDFNDHLRYRYDQFRFILISLIPCRAWTGVHYAHEEIHERVNITSATCDINKSFQCTTSS